MTAIILLLRPFDIWWVTPFVLGAACLSLILPAVRRSPITWLLLAMLAAHPGRAYTRRQLLDRVWGPEQVGDPRTVDVHVRWLRSKIEPQPDRPIHLVTVRGVGYRAREL